MKPQKECAFWTLMINNTDCPTAISRPYACYLLSLEGGDLALAQRAVDRHHLLVQVPCKQRCASHFNPKRASHGKEE